VVDLPCYNQVFSDENAIDSLVRIFDTAVNSKLFARTTFILFLNNISAFRQQLAYEPLGKYFPDYSGSNDAEKASEFLIRRFEQVNRSRRSLYSYLVDPYNTSNIQLVSNAIISSI
jgi:guanine nucleotide-binding protein G(i) subunit alpha